MAAAAKHSGRIFVSQGFKKHADGKSAELFVNGK
jgi:hypothetical protein